MRDFAISDSPAVQTQLDRLGALSLPQGRFGLDTIRALLARLGDPQRDLPPVLHVAGTNGKGSTCAYLRAMLEAQGYTVHAATKPHLVRYNERIRIAGKLIEDEHLASLLKEVLDAGENLAPSFFEVTTAATFLAFHRTPADACVIEVGLGGRFDATNVLEGQAVCGIASLGIDHEAFLLAPEEGVPAEPLERIAFEKAGIARPGVPLVTQAYPPAVTKTIIDHAMRVGAKTAIRDLDWSAEIGATIAYLDRRGELDLPLPALAGAHQADNAALAVAMLRHQSALEVSPQAMAQGIRAARWPARLQLLAEGPLTALVPGRKVWLDGGHNPDAGRAIARHFANPVHLIIGMLASKNPQAITGPLEGKIRSLTVIPVPGSESHPAEAFGADARSADGIEAALLSLPPDDYPVLMVGSLYLAGEVLRLNAEFPD
ncbi:MAG: bifunctional folylpolyglutamate synthase/dihydrofolate synthase [Novosphingobium sp.]